MQPFVIAINGLKQGSTQFEWRADSKFFGNFDNPDIREASLEVVATAEKAGRFLGIGCSVEGDVTVVCDRCLDPLVLPVDVDFALSVKFGEAEERAESGDREIVMLSEGESELDLSQFVYDWVCTSLPMHRVHPDGQCNPEVLKYLGKEDESAQAAPATESPFAALKDILK